MSNKNLNNLELNKTCRLQKPKGDIIIEIKKY